MTLIFFESDYSKVRISCQKVDDEGGFCIVVDLENCDDMLYWLLACKITFACYLQDCEQKKSCASFSVLTAAAAVLTSNTFQQFAISTTCKYLDSSTSYTLLPPIVIK